MEIEKEKQCDKFYCPDGNCPTGIDKVKKFGLTPREKRAIFFAIKRKIFMLKKLRYVLESID